MFNKKNTQIQEVAKTIKHIELTLDALHLSIEKTVMETPVPAITPAEKLKFSQLIRKTDAIRSIRSELWTERRALLDSKFYKKNEAAIKASMQF